MYDKRLAETISYIRGHISQAPWTGVVLGSGLSGFERKLARRVVLENRDIPHYPVPHIEGHPGRLVFGRIAPSKARHESLILVFVGRVRTVEALEGEGAIQAPNARWLVLGLRKTVPHHEGRP